MSENPENTPDAGPDMSNVHAPASDLMRPARNPQGTEITVHMADLQDDDGEDDDEDGRPARPEHDTPTHRMAVRMATRALAAEEERRQATVRAERVHHVAAETAHLARRVAGQELRSAYTWGALVVLAFAALIASVADSELFTGIFLAAMWATLAADLVFTVACARGGSRLYRQVDALDRALSGPSLR